MRLCQHPSDCLHYCEGTTDYCASHNAEERKKKRDEEKEKHKRSKQQALSEQRNRKYAERARARLSGTGTPDSGQKNSKPAQGNIKPRSNKRAGEEREYARRRKKYLLMHPDCERCGKPATEIHHRAGRIGKLLINVMYFMAVCPDCHHWIEEHPIESKEKGYSINRLTL